MIPRCFRKPATRGRRPHEDDSRSDRIRRGDPSDIGDRADAGAAVRQPMSRAWRCASGSTNSSPSTWPVRSRWSCCATRTSKRPGAPARSSNPSCRSARCRAPTTGATTFSYGWLEDAPEGEGVVGSYGRVFDVIAMGRPEPKAIGLQVRALESGLFESGRPVLLAPPVPLRTFGTNVADRLELQHRAGAHHGARHAAAPTRRAGDRALCEGRRRGSRAAGERHRRATCSATACRRR